MITEQYFLMNRDLIAYELLETAKRFSECKDKQVAAVCMNADDDVLAISWNRKTSRCIGDCDAKHKTCAIHAEDSLLVVPGSIVYVSLFPCVNCQMILFSKGVTRVYVFGGQHKEDCGILDITILPDLVKVLTLFNGGDKQKSVVMGELGELITAVANSQRRDTRDHNTPEELIDVELQLTCLRRIIPTHMIHSMKKAKYNNLLGKFAPDPQEMK